MLVPTDQHLLALIDNTDSMIWSVDLDFRLVAFNKALEKRISNDFDCKLQVGMPLDHALPAEEVVKWRSLYERVVENGPLQVEVAIPHRRTLGVTLNLIHSEGKACGISVFASDITRQKELEAAARASEARYQQFLNGTSDGVCQATLEGKLLSANHALAAMLGYDSVEDLTSSIRVLGRDLWDAPWERRQFLRHLEENEVAMGYEVRFRRKDGSPIWVCLNVYKHFDEDDNFLYLKTFVQDINERKEAERKLRLSEERFRSIFEESISAMLLISPDSGAIRGANQAAALFYGYPRAQLTQLNIADLNCLPNTEISVEMKKAAYGRRSLFHFRHALASGEVRDVDVYSSKVELNDGPALFSIIHDATERNRAIGQLEESERRYRELFEGSGSVMLIIDPSDDSIVDANDAAAAFYGYSRQALREMHSWDINVGWDDDVKQKRRHLALTQSQQVLRSRHRIANGEIRDVEIYPTRINWLGKANLFSIVQDITERVQAEKSLRESEERYHATFDNAAVGIVHASFDGLLIRVNKRFAEMLNYSSPEELQGTNFLDITASEDQQQSFDVASRILAREIEYVDFEKRYRRKDGTTFWALISVSMQRDNEGEPWHMLTMVQDIDARKRAEERLAATSRALAITEDRYSKAFHTSLDSMTINRLDNGAFVDFNESFCKMHGYRPEEVLGRDPVALNLWADPMAFINYKGILARNGECRNLEARFRKKDGQTIWGLISASLVEFDGIPCALSVSKDITDLKNAQDRLSNTQTALSVTEERYRSVFQTSLDAITISRMQDGAFLDINDAHCAMLGYTPDELIGHTPTELGIWANPSERDRLLAIMASRGACQNFEAQFHRKNGEAIWGMVSAKSFDLGGVPHLLCITKDITEEKFAEEQIRNLAFYDSLTGLANRRLLLDRLRRAVALARRSDHKNALLFLDIDNFKTVNDTLGHHNGDKVLQRVGSSISRCVRESDTIARIGGDEFVVILENLSGDAEVAATQAQDVGQKVLETLREPFLLEGHELLNTASIGIAIFGNPDDTAAEVLQQADIAMYQAKATGRNSVHFFVPELQAAVNAKANLIAELRHAITEEQFVLWYQPKVEFGAIIGAEALIRWQHPVHGLIAPGAFISLAEETGQIVALGNWGLIAACRQLAAWSKVPSRASLDLSVNITARQLGEPDFVERVLELLKESGVKPQRLILELTESSVVKELQNVTEKMERLRAHGVRFSLDDFGTGYSSLSYLKRLPLDELKIDRSFVSDIATNSENGAIAQAIVTLSKALGLKVVAEGVETLEQLVSLEGLGCHCHQGYLFSRPLPVEEFDRLPLTLEAASPAAVPLP